MIILRIKKAISYQKILYKKTLLQNRWSLNLNFSKTWLSASMMLSLISIFTLIFQLISIFAHLSLVNTSRSTIFTTRFFSARFLIRSKSSTHFISHRHIWICLQKKTMTVEKRYVLSFFLNDSISKTFTNLQNLTQITLHAMKNCNSYRFSSSHDFEKRELQFFTSFFNQLIDFDFLDLNARQFFNLDQFIDFDDLKHPIDLNFFDIKTRQLFANFFDARQFSNLDRFIDFDNLKHSIDFDNTRRFSANFFSARQSSNLNQSIDFAFSLRRFSKRQRFTEIINNVKKQIVQSSMLKETKTFLTTSTRLIDFLYSRIVTQKNRQKCDAFSMTYDRFLNVMNKNEHDDLFWFSREGDVINDTQHSN